MDESRYEVSLVLNALKMSFRSPVLFWEGVGLLIGFVCFNFLTKVSLLPVSEGWAWLLFPLLLPVGLFLLYMCVAVGNTAAVVLLRREPSPLAEWTDVLPLDKNVIRSLVMSALFLIVGAALLVGAILIALPAKPLREIWLAFCGLPILLIAALSIVTMFQGLFLFPAFISTEIDERECLQRFSKFLQANWSRILRFEALFIGIAILLAIPQTAVAYLSHSFLATIATSLGLLPETPAGPALWNNFAGLVVNTLALAPLYALCALIPVSFLTAASYLFCAQTASGEAPTDEEA